MSGLHPDQVEYLQRNLWMGVKQMPEQLGTTVLAQVGVVVRDIEVAARAWAGLLGVPVPAITLTDTYEVTRATYKGEPTPARVKLAFFQLGPVNLELMEPVGEPSTWKDQLDQHGNSLHHLAFKVGSLDDMMEKLVKLEADGLSLIQRGDWRPNGRYLYLDGIEKLGTVLELLPGPTNRPPTA